MWKPAVFGMEKVRIRTNSKCMGFSLFRTSEFFVIRKMEMSETKTHLLCGWSQIVIQKITFPLQ